MSDEKKPLFHGIPTQEFIKKRLEKMGWDIIVRLWTVAPRRGHHDDPADEKINLDTFQHGAAVQELMDPKLAKYVYAEFEPQTKGKKGEFWNFNGESWYYRKRGVREWKKTNTGNFDYESEEELHAEFLKPSG
jgi:hypothetical protein